MNIGLCGFGVVGRGVYEIVRQRPDMKVKKILCLEDIQLPDAQTVKDFSEILNDPEIDTVVEAMGGLHPSFDFAYAALEAGKNFVTSTSSSLSSKSIISSRSFPTFWSWLAASSALMSLWYCSLASFPDPSSCWPPEKSPQQAC